VKSLFEKEALEGENVMRSVFERSLALFLLVVLLPILIIIGIGVWVDSPGPIIFRQERVGYRGRPFIVYKFRSMYDKPWPIGDILVNDPRVTPFGRLIRKTHFDELPQLWNIVRGEMVFIGPRPQTSGLAMKYSKLYPKRYNRRFLLIPGITGLAQIVTEKGHFSKLFRYIALDEVYRQKRCVGLDIRIALKTIAKMMKGTSR